MIITVVHGGKGALAMGEVDANELSDGMFTLLGGTLVRVRMEWIHKSVKESYVSGATDSTLTERVRMRLWFSYISFVSMIFPI